MTNKERIEYCHNNKDCINCPYRKNQNCKSVKVFDTYIVYGDLYEYLEYLNPEWLNSENNDSKISSR